MAQSKQIKLTKNDIDFLIERMAKVNAEEDANKETTLMKLNADERMKMVTMASTIMTNESSMMKTMNIDDNSINTIKTFLINYQKIINKSTQNQTTNNNEKRVSENNTDGNYDDPTDEQQNSEIQADDTNNRHQKSISMRSLINKPIMKANNERPRPRGWYQIDDYTVEPVLIIKKNKATGNELAVEISDILMNDKNDLGKITQFIPKEDHVIAYFNSLSSLNHCIEAVNNNHKEWKVIVPDDIKPKIKILGVFIHEGKNYDWQSFINRLKIRNEWPESAPVKFCFAYSPRKNKFYDIIIQVTARIRNDIEINRGEISVDNLKKFVIDHFDIRRCTVCFEYGGHLRDRCNNAQRCPYCSSKHESCPVKTCKNQYRCPACNGQGHSAFSKNCPKYKAALNKALKKIEYEYKWIMAKPTIEDY